MKLDEIIEMAKQAGLLDMDYEIGQWEIHEFTIFAKLVAEAEKERIAKKIEKLPFGDMAQSFAIWVRNDT